MQRAVLLKGLGGDVQVGTERAGFLDLQNMNSIKPRQDILWALKTILNDLNVQEYKGLID